MSGLLPDALKPEEVGRLWTGAPLLVKEFDGSFTPCLFTGPSTLKPGFVAVEYPNGFGAVSPSILHPTDETAARLRPTSIVLTRTVELDSFGMWLDRSDGSEGDLRVQCVEIAGENWANYILATAEVTVKLTPKEAPSA